MAGRAMSAVQLFNVSGSDIRFGVTTEGIPYAVASDYAKVMGYGQASDATLLLGDNDTGQQMVLPLVALSAWTSSMRTACGS